MFASSLSGGSSALRVADISPSEMVGLSEKGFWGYCFAVVIGCHSGGFWWRFHGATKEIGQPKGLGFRWFWV